jgi:hypothetical protein
MRCANSLVITAVGALLTLLGSTGLSSAQTDQKVYQLVPGLQILDNNTNVRPTAGVEEYKCDSEKNTCKCTSASDCDKMKTDGVCAKDYKCLDDECWCTWR